MIRSESWVRGWYPIFSFFLVNHYFSCTHYSPQSLLIVHQEFPRLPPPPSQLSSPFAILHPSPDLPQSAFMDRRNQDLPKSQIGFLDFVVKVGGPYKWYIIWEYSSFCPHMCLVFFFCCCWFQHSVEFGLPPPPSTSISSPSHPPAPHRSLGGVLRGPPPFGASSDDARVLGQTTGGWCDELGGPCNHAYLMAAQYVSFLYFCLCVFFFFRFFHVEDDCCCKCIFCWLIWWLKHKEKRHYEHHHVCGYNLDNLKSTTNLHLANQTRKQATFSKKEINKRISSHIMQELSAWEQENRERDVIRASPFCLLTPCPQSSCWGLSGLQSEALKWKRGEILIEYSPVFIYGVRVK